MPKNVVTDPITDPEITFAHLLLSGTMNDRQAAEAAGLNPTTAAYTKAKQRVRQYMDQHRAAVSERLVDQETEGLRRLNLGRDQILARLWELATLSPEATRGSIAGQIKAMTMIAAIEGLLPDRRNGNHPPRQEGEPASPQSKANIYVSEWMRKEDPGQSHQSVTAVEANSAPPVPEPSFEPASQAPPVIKDQNQTGPINPFIDPKGANWIPNPAGPALNAYNSIAGSLRLPLAR